MRSVIVMLFLLAPLALSAEQGNAGESQWSEYLNHDYHFRVKYPAYINWIEERGRATVRLNPISPRYQWRENNLLFHISFGFGDPAAMKNKGLLMGLMWIDVCSNSEHADLRSAADSIMRQYTHPGQYMSYDTSSVAGEPAILAETWDGWYNEKKTDLLETYVFLHKDLVVALTIDPINFVSSRGDTLGLAGDKKDRVVKSFNWICH